MSNITVTYDPAWWRLVPKQPTIKMLYAAAQDGKDLDGRPVWKHMIDVQNAWRWGQMLKASPEVKEETEEISALHLLQKAEAVLRDIRDACDGSASAELVGSDLNYIYGLIQEYFLTTER